MTFAQSLVGFIKLSEYQYLDFKRMSWGPCLILPKHLALHGSMCTH